MYIQHDMLKNSVDTIKQRNMSANKRLTIK